MSEGNKAQKKKAQLREAAYRCFQKSGYYETTVDDICNKAQCSKGSFYYHYASKQEVFIDILQVWAREVISEMLKRFEDALANETPMSAVTQAIQDEVRRGRALVPLWLEFTVHAHRDELVRNALSKFFRRARNAISEMLEPLTRERFSEEESEGIATGIFGIYTGLLMQELADPGSVDASEAVAQIMSVMGRLLGPMA
ncbi:MAG: TetR/AcrR family transcriptional regulator [Myxococcales bacterium]|nr:TetR/AcrR family transcriptional regulator [Myxococcales bacterium]MCB9641762.1 TetR/AcrR family transcriptional regulator [Myxococcales bacterium]